MQTITYSCNKFVLLRNMAVLCMLGNVLYFLFPFPAIVWRFSFILLCLYCTFDNGVKFGFSKLEKAILVFVVLNLAYFFISCLWLKPSTYIIGSTLYAMLSFIMFAFLGKMGVLTMKFVTVVSLITVVVSVPYFYHEQQAALSKLSTEIDDVTVNATVLFLTLLPLFFLVRNRFVSFVSFCVCLFFLILGAKRGNIVAAIIPTVLYTGLLFKESKKSLGRVLIFILLVVGVAVWLRNVILADEYLLMRYEDTLEGHSSGRDMIYPVMWNMWAESGDVVKLLFGYGYDGTVTYSYLHKYAHNDWLEVLVDFGIIGIMCYVTMFILFVKFYLAIRQRNMRYAFLSIIFIWFFKSLYSAAYATEMFAFMAIPFGCCYDKNWLKR